MLNLTYLHSCLRTSPKGRLGLMEDVFRAPTLPGQILGRSNRTQCCQRLATAATLLRKELLCRVAGAITRRWAHTNSFTRLRLSRARK